jgi:hypothetical protein
MFRHNVTRRYRCVMQGYANEMRERKIILEIYDLFVAYLNH